MSRTACKEPQCLYKGDLYLTLYYVSIFIYVRKYEELWFQERGAFLFKM